MKSARRCARWCGEQPQIARISLAVMVDGETVKTAEGKPLWHERSADDIARIRRLVQSAIGFDEKRGDKVEVVSMQFAPQADDLGTPAPPGLFGMDLQKTDLVSLAQSGILAVVVLTALLVVLRPMAMRLTSLPSAEMSGGGLLAGALAGGNLLAGAGVNPALLGSGGSAMVPTGLLTDDSMISVANIDGQVRASALRKLAEVVEKHPEETLNIVRGWLTEEQS